VSLRVVRRLDGGVELDGLAPWVVSVLAELPLMLSDEVAERARSRLFPYASDDADHRRDWERYVHPELAHLFASARELVTADLTEMRQSGAPSPSEPVPEFRLRIPGDHVAAWLSALNAARLTLAELHDVDAADMEREDFETDDPRALVVGTINVLGHVQHALVEARLDEGDDEDG